MTQVGHWRPEILVAGDLMDELFLLQTIADVVRTCLGPRAMLKMLMDPMGGICLTNDGNAILREITVQHPAAKSLIEIARTQDEEVQRLLWFSIFVREKHSLETKITHCLCRSGMELLL